MRRALTVAGRVLGLIIALYLIVRAAVEPFLLDFSDPASYRENWGGPSVLGVLAVHCGPGLLAAATLVVVLRRSRAGPGRARLPRR